MLCWTYILLNSHIFHIQNDKNECTLPLVYMLLFFSSKQAGLCGLSSYSVLIYSGNDEPTRYFISSCKLRLLNCNVYIHVVFPHLALWRHHVMWPALSEDPSGSRKNAELCSEIDHHVSDLSEIHYICVLHMLEHWNTCERLILAHIIRRSVKGPVLCKNYKSFLTIICLQPIRPFRNYLFCLLPFRLVATPSASCSSLWHRLWRVFP